MTFKFHTNTSASEALAWPLGMLDGGFSELREGDQTTSGFKKKKLLNCMEGPGSPFKIWAHGCQLQEIPLRNGLFLFLLFFFFLFLCLSENLALVT